MSVEAVPDRIPGVAGIDIGGTKIDVAVATAAGEILQVRRLETRSPQGAAQALDRALGEVSRLADQYDLVVDSLGIAVPGVVRGGRVTHANNIPGLDELDLLVIVGERFGSAAVVVLNDLNAAASLEIAQGSLAGESTGLVVGLGTGIAVGVVIDGKLHVGTHGAAGEIGYSEMIAPDTDGDVAGEVSTLEELAGGRAFDRLARRWGLRDAAALLDRSDIDGHLSAIVTARLGLLASTLSICCRLLDPSTIFFFGGLSRSRKVREYLERELRAHSLTSLEIVWQAEGENAALHGAVRSAVRRHVAPSRSVG